MLNEYQAVTALLQTQMTLLSLTSIDFLAEQVKQDLD